MKLLKRFLAVALSFNIAGYTLPVFAAQSDVAEPEAQMIEITDKQMSSLVGAGNVDANVSDYPSPGEDASAVIVNRSQLYMPYSLVGTDINRGITETIASGSILPNSAIIVSGPITSSSTYVLQAKIGGIGIRALESIDSTMQ